VITRPECENKTYLRHVSSAAKPHSSNSINCRENITNSLNVREPRYITTAMHWLIPLACFHIPSSASYLQITSSYILPLRQKVLQNHKSSRRLQFCKIFRTDQPISEKKNPELNDAPVRCNKLQVYICKFRS